MKSLSLITKTKITAGKVSQKLIDSFRWKKRLVQNDDGELFVGYAPNEFYIVYDDSMSIDDPICLFEDEEKKRIPFENAVVNELFYRNNDVAKYVVGIILSEYPELYVEDDDGNMASASEFIK